MLKYAKPIDQLLSATIKNKEIMEEYVEYYEGLIAMKNDIFEKYDYPLLRSGIEELIELVKKKTRSYIEMSNAGYTADDATILMIYNKENQRPEK